MVYLIKVIITLNLDSEYDSKTNKSVIIITKSPQIVKLHHIKYSILCIHLSHEQWMLVILSHLQVQPVAWPSKVAASQKDFSEMSEL